MKIDGRTLPHDTSELIRRWAVRRVKAGESPASVMKSYGLCRTTVYRWLRAVKRGGEKALRARQHLGPKQKLTPAQKLKVRHWINGKDPRQYGFDFGLWTRQIVAGLITKRFGVKLGVTAVGRLLAELDITPQKPLRRAYERDPAAIKRWKTQEFPKLRARAKRCGAKIFFLDEAGVRSDQVLGRTWGLRGQTPEVPTSGKRQSVNAISTVNALGEFWFEIYAERLNATKFIDLLKRFMRRRRSPVFVVLDGHPAHIAKSVARYVQSLKGRLELHFLPGYAPELNPDEFVWNHLKRQGVSKKPLLKNESLRHRVHASCGLSSKPRL
jgi:transposase